MEERPKSESPPSTTSDQFSDGWTGVHPNPKRLRPVKEPQKPVLTELDDLEKQVSAGWDGQES